MSFTIKVKEEIIAASSKDIAELSALIKMSGSVGLTNQGLTLSISTENAKIARHIYQLIENRYRCNPELRHYNKTNLKKNRVYTVFVAENVNDILSDLQLADSFFGFETGIETSIMEDDDAGRSYLRGAFWQLERYVILKRTLSIGNFLCLSGPRRRFSLSYEKNLCLMQRFYNIKMDL